jgi:hypothetical protein
MLNAYKVDQLIQKIYIQKNYYWLSKMMKYKNVSLAATKFDQTDHDELYDFFFRTEMLSDETKFFGITYE